MLGRSRAHTHLRILWGTQPTELLTTLVFGMLATFSLRALLLRLVLLCSFNPVIILITALNWLPAPTDIVVLDKTNTSLEISWSPPVIHETGHNAVINQHLMNVYEFIPSSKSLVKKFSLNVPVPKTSYSIGRLTPGSVYNVTLQVLFESFFPGISFSRPHQF
ncbi:unnamed protein product [Haemonchus placei]|uniref:Fibronectin type-III domain-containing protein n=1 Tax=Haemonchus placei TaxID=6290 RepID=A0A158QP99_HAEPC|nr:unnamed protein product [Haemonchus placei]